jgi:hypothetical protein
VLAPVVDGDTGADEQILDDALGEGQVVGARELDDARPGSPPPDGTARPGISGYRSG